MDGEIENPRSHFDIGRSAARSGDFAKALEKFQYFFDHALDDDPGALYGVRLSYCLAEWARLGEKYSPAASALVQKKDESLANFEKTRDPEYFHDFVAICGHLKLDEDVVKNFLRIDKLDRDLSATAYRFARDCLIAHECWSTCSAHTRNSRSTYDQYLRKFDEVIKLGQTHSDIGGPEFESTMRNLFIKDASSLLLLLRNSDRTAELDAIQLSLVEDMKSRGQADIPDLIFSRVAI